MMMTPPEPPSPAVKAKVLQLFEGDGIPDCVIDGIARRCGIGSNGKLMYAKPTGEENFPVLELMRLQDSLAVRPYLKGFLLRDAGLEAMIRNMLLCNEQLREVAVKGFALGYAECFRVMGIPEEAMLALSVQAWLADHPQEPLGLLMQAHIMGVQRGDAWLVRRLEQVAARMPTPLLRAKVLATAAELQYEMDSDMAGALRNAEAALQLMPQHLDMLFVRANCLHSLSGVLDDTDEDPSKVTEQVLPQTALVNVHKQAAAAQQAFIHYFEVAAPEHPHKPAAHFNYALLLLSASDLQYSVCCHVAGVPQQASTAAAKAAATVRSLAAATSNPELWDALLVLKQVMDEFTPLVESAYRAGLAAERGVPRWYRHSHVPQVKTPQCVKENLEQRQRTVERIKAIEQERGGAAAPRAAANSSSSSSSGVAAAGARQSASSSSSRTAAGATGASSSSAVPPATDEQLRAALLRLVAASDVTVVTYKQLQQQLEAQFQMDLSHKNSFLKQILVDNVNVQQQPGSASSPSSSCAAGRLTSPAAAAAASGDASESSSCCKVCKVPQAKLMRCSRCKAVKYCSTACQTEDWKTHKAVCVKKA